MITPYFLNLRFLQRRYGKKKMGFEIIQIGLRTEKSHSDLLAAESLWVNHLTTLSLNVLICKTGIRLLTQGCYEV